MLWNETSVFKRQDWVNQVVSTEKAGLGSLPPTQGAACHMGGCPGAKSWKSTSLPSGGSSGGSFAFLFLPCSVWTFFDTNEYRAVEQHRLIHQDQVFNCLVVNSVNADRRMITAVRIRVNHLLHSRLYRWSYLVQITAILLNTLISQYECHAHDKKEKRVGLYSVFWNVIMGGKQSIIWRC